MDTTGAKILRRNSTAECGALVGHMALKIQGSPREFDIVNFYCTKPKQHRDACAFVGVELMVVRRRRE